MATLDSIIAERHTYYQLTCTATYSFLAALPLLVLYEVFVLFVGGGQIRIGAEVWVKQLLALFGLVGWMVFGVVVLVVGVAIFYAERQKHIPIRPRYLGWMLAESAIYAVVLAFVVSGVVGLLFAFAPQGQVPGFGTRLVLSIGAGLYEELVFRVLLVGGLYLLLRRLAPQQRQAYGLAALIGAVLFSAVHYVGPFGDAFTLPSFVFRFLFGLALNVLFLLRGFGIAAWTHALYDVFLTVRLL